MSTAEMAIGAAEGSLATLGFAGVWWTGTDALGGRQSTTIVCANAAPWRSFDTHTVTVSRQS